MTTQQVWTTYSLDLRKFIMSKVKDISATDDVLQDTFIKIHTKLHTLKDVSKLKSWAFTIARNSIMDYFKTFTQIEQELAIEIAVADTNYDHEHTEHDCLYGILVNLPKKYRDPLFLSDIKGMKQHEVAEQLQQTLSTTKSQIQRARKLIAKGFMDCCGFVLNKDGNLVGELQEKENCQVCNH